MLNFNHLHYFHVAASEGTIAATASRLGVTQPTISEQIRALERVLGVPLFERTATGLRLTEPGRLAYEYTCIIFSAGERLIEALGHGPGDELPVMRVGMTTGVARAPGPALLVPLLELGEFFVSTRNGHPSELLRSLRGGGLDLILTDTAPPAGEMRGLEAAEIGRSALVAIGPPDCQPTDTWSDVRALRYRGAAATRTAVDEFLAERGLCPRFVGEVEDAVLLIEATAHGFVAFVPQVAGAQAVADGRVKVLATIDSTPTTVHAIYEDGRSSSVARKAIATVVARMAGARHA
jgi:LysR family transcriptional activator of nhaA